MWLPLELAVDDLRRHGSRVGLMVFALASALAAYALLGSVIGEMRYQAAQMARLVHPYDAIVRIPQASEELEKARATSGVAGAEVALTVDVVMSYGHTTVLVLDRTSRIMVYDVESGALPTEADEVALPSAVARSAKLDVGDLVNVLPADADVSTQHVDIRVCGLLSDRMGVPHLPTVTLEGAARLGLVTLEPNALLLLFDGRVKAATIQRELELAMPGAAVTVYETQYQAATRATSLADTMAAALRLLLLMVSSATVAALFHLAEKSRAYEAGVLRAIGMRAVTLLTRAFLGAAAVIAVGCVIGLGLAWLAARFLEIPIARATRGLVADTMVFVAVAMGVTMATSARSASLSVGHLLRDSWNTE